MKIIKENEKEIEIEGEDITLFSVLRGYLAEMDEVDFVAFKREHPLKKSVRLFLRVKKGAPRDVLKKAAEEIKSDASSFAKELGGK